MIKFFRILLLLTAFSQSIVAMDLEISKQDQSVFLHDPEMRKALEQWGALRCQKRKIDELSEESSNDYSEDSIEIDGVKPSSFRIVGLSEEAHTILHNLFCCMNIAALLQTDRIDAENSIVDLISWLSDDFEGIKNLVHDALKSDGSIDYGVLSPKIKSALNKFRETSFVLRSGEYTCMLDKKIVSYFPCFYKNKDENIFSLEKGYSKNTLIAFKKILYALYFKRKYNDMTFEEMNRYAKYQNLTDIQEYLIENAFDAPEEFLADLVSIACCLNIKALMVSIFTYLRQYDEETIRQQLQKIAMKHFLLIAKLVRKRSNYIAQLTALKINAEMQELNKNEGTIQKCLEILIKHCCELRIDDEKHSKQPPFTTKVENYNKYYAQTPFYNLLNKDAQKMLKTSLCTRYTVPTFSSQKIPSSLITVLGEKMASLYKIENIQSEYGNDFVYVYLKNPHYLEIYKLCDGISILYHILPLPDNIHCIRGFSQNYFCIITGNSEGIVRISAVKQSVNLRPNMHNSAEAFPIIALHPLSHSGKVTALVQTGQQVIAAYESGALASFNPLNLLTPQLYNEKKQIELYSTPELYFSLPEEKKENEACHLIAAQGHSIAGAFKKGNLKLWQDKMLRHRLTLTTHHNTTLEIVSMRFIAQDQIAVGCNDGTVFLVNVEKGSLDRTIAPKGLAYDTPVLDLIAMGENGGYLAIAYQNGCIHVWDLNGKQHEPLKKIVKQKSTTEKNTGESYASICLSVSKENKAVLQATFIDGSREHTFIPECAQVGDFMHVLQNKLF